MSRYLIHPVIRRHIRQHGIIERQTPLIPHLGDHIDPEEQKPPCRYSKHCAAQHPNSHEAGKHWLFKTFHICYGSENRPQDCRDHRYQ